MQYPRNTFPGQLWSTEFSQNPMYAPESMVIYGREETEFQTTGWTTPTPDFPYGNIHYHPIAGPRKSLVNNQYISGSKDSKSHFTHLPLDGSTHLAHNGEEISFPGSTPENEATARLKISKQSLCFLVFKRCLSIVFILLDTVFDWLQYFDMEDPESGDKSEDGSIGCSDLEASTEIAFMAFSILGTIFAVVQIINLIAETVYEASNGKKGFQIFHGYYEVCISYIIEDLPQIVTTFLFISASCECNTDQIWIIRVLESAIASVFSNFVRKLTCRKEKRPCCACTWDWPYCCCFVPICGYDQNCHPQCVDPCDCRDCGCYCIGNNGCCDPREKDPKCAEMIGDKLGQLHVAFLIFVCLQITLLNCFKIRV